MLKEINNPNRWNAVYGVIDWIEIISILVAELQSVYSLYYLILPISVFVECTDIVKYRRNKRDGAYNTKGIITLDTMILIFQVIVMICGILRISYLLSV